LFSVLNSLAGGVVLGAAFSHMLPEASEQLGDYFVDEHYPYVPFIAIFAMLVLFTIEKLLMDDDDHYHHIQTEEERSTRHITTETLPLTKAGTVKSEEIGAAFNLGAINSQSAALGAYIFLVALSIHSTLEGLGMGGENVGNAFWGVFIAVVSHKGLEALALGLRIYEAKFTFIRSAGLITLYATATPIGIGIGMLAASAVASDKALLVKGVLLSLATGSFIYIALLEIIPSEIRGKGWRLFTRLAFLYIGWLFMVLVAKWTH